MTLLDSKRGMHIIAGAHETKPFAAVCLLHAFVSALIRILACMQNRIPYRSYSALQFGTASQDCKYLTLREVITLIPRMNDCVNERSMYACYRSGLTSQQLAHHDLMTSDSRSRTSDRHKVSIDKWNQDGTEPPVSNPEPEKWSHDPHLAAHFDPESADQVGAYRQLSYDDPSIYQGDQYQGHQSSVSHHPHGGHSPARRYDPYDLSPAYLDAYPDESADPSIQHGSYPAAGAGHVHDSYDSSGHQYSYADQKQARLPHAENSYISDDHERSYLEPNSTYMGQSLPSREATYSNVYNGQHDQSSFQQRSPQDPSPFDFGVQQSYPSQNKQQYGESDRSQNSYPGGKPCQSSMTYHQSNSHEEEHWGQPNSTAASGWDDGISQNPKSAGDHIGQVQHSDYSQWRAPIEEGRRERGRGRAPGKGRGRGNAQQKPPAKPKVSD